MQNNYYAKIRWKLHEQEKKFLHPQVNSNIIELWKRNPKSTYGFRNIIINDPQVIK